MAKTRTINMTAEEQEAKRAKREARRQRRAEKKALKRVTSKEDEKTSDKKSKSNGLTAFKLPEDGKLQGFFGEWVYLKKDVDAAQSLMTDEEIRMLIRLLEKATGHAIMDMGVKRK